MNARIIIAPEIGHGKPTIHGTRVPIIHIISRVGACPRPEAEMNSATTISFLSLRAEGVAILAGQLLRYAQDDIGGKIAELVPSASEESHSAFASATSRNRKAPRNDKYGIGPCPQPKGCPPCPVPYLARQKRR